jgi:hypothetical protein
MPRWTALLAVVLLAIVGCGGSDSDADSGPSASPSESIEFDRDLHDELMAMFRRDQAGRSRAGPGLVGQRRVPAGSGRRRPGRQADVRHADRLRQRQGQARDPAGRSGRCRRAACRRGPRSPRRLPRRGRQDLCRRDAVMPQVRMRRQWSETDGPPRSRTPARAGCARHRWSPRSGRRSVDRTPSARAAETSPALPRRC